MPDRQDLLLLTYNQAAPAPEIVIANPEEVSMFGLPHKPAKKNMLAYILPDLNPNQIDCLCEVINHVPDKGDLHAEPVTQNEHCGIQLSSETHNQEFMAALLLKAMRAVAPKTQSVQHPAP